MALITSLGSTLLLHTVAHPYVISIVEIVPLIKDTQANDSPTLSNTSTSPRLFRATRLNMFGQNIDSTFNLSQVK